MNSSWAAPQQLSLGSTPWEHSLGEHSLGGALRLLPDTVVPPSGAPTVPFRSSPAHSAGVSIPLISAGLNLESLIPIFSSGYKP